MAKKGNAESGKEESKKGDNKGEKPIASTIIPTAIVGEMRDSYLDYAMSVIASRALPDVRDGLKPVHRRILYAMHELGVTHAGRYKKSAAIVGDVLGKYHPHGDTAVYDAMVKMAQDFSSRYPLVQGQGNFGCFTKDTKVQLTDGRSLRFDELVEEHKAGKRNWTFSFDHKNGKVEVAEIKDPRITRKHADLMEVELDNGEKIRCTPDHRFMLRDGVYREAQFLKAGTSLMPLYSRQHDGAENKKLKNYLQVLQPFEQSWSFAHHLADAWNIRNGVYKKSAGRVRHHVDFDKHNNNPDNIQRMQWEDHWKLHAKMASWRHKNDPVYVEKLAKGRAKFIEENPEFISKRATERNKQMWQDPAYRDAQIARLKAMWEDKEYKEFMRKQSSETLKRSWKDPAFQELMSNYKRKEMKARWQDENYRKKMSAHMQKISNKIWSDPKHREFISRRMKEITADPKWKQKQSRIAKALWQSEEYRAKYPEDHFSNMAKELWQKEGIKEMHREKAKKQWEDPEFREATTNAIKKSNKRRLKQNPHYMKELAAQSTRSLKEKWKDPQYKEQVVKSKILRHVKNVKEKHNTVTSELYERERISNGVPRVEKALQKFNGFNEMVEKAETYNHKVVAVRFLRKKEDVYDLTIDMWHNFALAAGVFVHNSIDGDPPAAMRYTEARMNRLSTEMLRDIEKETVDWRANYDGTRKEPESLPAAIPHLILNGTLGIAVGMATSIPPHNLREILGAVIHLIENEKATTEDLLAFVTGPDYPTGGIVFGKDDIHQAYASGRGGVVARGEADIVEAKQGQYQIVITSTPYRVNKADLVMKIADLVRDKKLEGIKGLRDESTTMEDTRVVIDIKTGAQPQRILNYLYKHTELEHTFNFNMVALVDGVPQTLSLKGILEQFILHRKDVVLRRSKHDLRKAEERAHILEGLKKALDHIDKVIQVIKKSKDTPTAHKNLMKEFKFSERQATAILEMRLQKLAGLERKQVENELKEKKELIAYLKDLIKHPEKILAVVKEELEDIKEKYGDDRKTKVVASHAKTLSPEDLVEQKESMLVLTKGGYIKRTDPTEYRKQKRGGVGVVDMNTKDEDFVTTFLTANTHDDLLFFTDKGKAYQLKMYELPEGKRATKGKSIMNFLQLSDDESVTNVLAMPKDAKEAKNWSLFMVTKSGVAKKVASESFFDVRRSGIIAIKLSSDDELFSAVFVQKGDEVVLASRKGQAIRFKESDIRQMGRTAGGVKAMTIKKGDEIVGAGVAKKDVKDSFVLVMSDNGHGKQTNVKEYKVQKRGGSGIKTVKLSEKTGDLVSAKVVTPDDQEIVAISKKGQVIRTDIKDIPELGRQTQGVRIMKLKEGDKIASLVAF